MNGRFDIFWFGEDGPNWVGAVDTLEAAKDRIERLPQGSSGGYGVLDRRTGNRLSFATKLEASTAIAKQLDGQLGGPGGQVEA